MSQPQPNPEPTVLTACGGAIRDPQNYPQALYRGKAVFFCTKACLRAFEQDPDRFMAGEIDHPDDEE